MTAIIKNNFRLQNARDFLENLHAHPRTVDGVGKPLSESITVTNDGSSSGVGSASFSWQFQRTDPGSLPVFEDAATQAVRGLKLNVGAHINDRNHYLFVGKPLPWGSGSSSEELFPAPANDTLSEEARVWEEMLSLKKIIDVSGSLVVPRFDWDSKGKTIYAIFDDKDSELYRQPTPQRVTQANQLNNCLAGSFYVLNDEHELFICLENKKDGVLGPSTERPARKNNPTELIDYSAIDGYVWKYITTIRSSDSVKFLTDSWIPVKTLGNVENDNSFQWSVENDAKPGSVLSFVVDNQGSGYVRTHKGTLSAIGTQTVGGATYGVAQLNALVGGDAPSSSSDWYNDCSLYITDGAGAGGVYKIVDYQADVLSERKIYIEGVFPNDVNLDGASYEILPELKIESNGTAPIKARPVVVGGQVVRILVTSAGLNATWCKATIPNGSAGGTGALVRPVLGPWKGLGKDIEKDLGAFFVMLTAKLEYAEGSGDFTTSNDYRQIGIIRDVREYDASTGEEKLASSATLSATKRLLVQSVTPSTNGQVFAPDEYIRQTLPNGVVVEGQVLDYTPSTVEGEGVVTFVQTPQTSSPDVTPFGSFVENQQILGAATGCQATIKVGGVIKEEVVKFKGEILYLENRRRVLRAPDQIEDIRAIVEF